MNDIPGMTVKEHHELTIGVLACCYKYVPIDLQKAIWESLDSAKAMGLDIITENVLRYEVSDDGSCFFPVEYND